MGRSGEKDGLRVPPEGQAGLKTSAVTRLPSSIEAGYHSGIEAGYHSGMNHQPTVTITPKPNGPLLVEGPCRVQRPDGTPIPVPPRKDGSPAQVVVLCRCGGSATKPFCDGSHKRNGFTDAPREATAPPV